MAAYARKVTGISVISDLMKFKALAVKTFAVRNTAVVFDRIARTALYSRAASASAGVSARTSFTRGVNRLVRNTVIVFDRVSRTGVYIRSMRDASVVVDRIFFIRFARSSALPYRMLCLYQTV